MLPAPLCTPDFDPLEIYSSAPPLLILKFTPQLYSYMGHTVPAKTAPTPGMDVKELPPLSLCSGVALRNGSGDGACTG